MKVWKRASLYLMRKKGKSVDSASDLDSDCHPGVAVHVHRKCGGFGHEDPA